MRRKLFMALALALVVSFSILSMGRGEAEDVDPEAWPDSIVLAADPGEGAEGLDERFHGIVRGLEEDLGIRVDFFSATDYAGVVEALIAGTAHIAHTGPFAYVIARDRGAPIEPVGSYIDFPGDDPSTFSVGLVRGDNEDIHSLEDLKGRNVCFIDFGSTTGFLYPAAGFMEVGLDAETDVNAIFTGNHEAAVMSMVAGDCDAAFTFEFMARRILFEDGTLQPGDIREIWESPVPGAAISVSTTLPRSLVEAIKETLIANNGTVLAERGLCLDDFIRTGPDGQPMCEFTTWGAWGLAPKDDSYWEPVREVCVATNAPACF